MDFIPLILICGTKGYSKPVQRYRGKCPVCRAQNTVTLVESYQRYCFCWIPMCKMGGRQQYCTCQMCGSKMPAASIAMDPQSEPL